MEERHSGDGGNNGFHFNERKSASADPFSLAPPACDPSSGTPGIPRDLYLFVAFLPHLRATVDQRMFRKYFSSPFPKLPTFTWLTLPYLSGLSPFLREAFIGTLYWNLEPSVIFSGWFPVTSMLLSSHITFSWPLDLLRLYTVQSKGQK